MSTTTPRGGAPGGVLGWLDRRTVPTGLVVLFTASAALPAVAAMASLLPGGRRDPMRMTALAAADVAHRQAARPLRLLMGRRPTECVQATRGSLGKPSTRSPMMLRWISLVPE